MIRNGFLGFGGSKIQSLDAGTYCTEVLKALGGNVSEIQYRSEVQKGIKDMFDGTKDSIISNKYRLSEVCRPDVISRIWNNRSMLIRNGSKYSKYQLSKIVTDIFSHASHSIRYDIVNRLEKDDLRLFLRRLGNLMDGRVSPIDWSRILEYDKNHLVTLVCNALDDSYSSNMLVTHVTNCFSAEVLQWIVTNNQYRTFR
jgi:hypothetical protein